MHISTTVKTPQPLDVTLVRAKYQPSLPEHMQVELDLPYSGAGISMSVAEARELIRALTAAVSESI